MSEIYHEEIKGCLNSVHKLFTPCLKAQKSKYLGL
jgi:hypothetical protein